MAGEWASCRFAQICEHSAFGPRFAGELYAADGNVATLRTTDISADGRIEYDTMPLARLDLRRFEQHTLQRSDLVITRSGRIGTAALFDGFRLPVLPGAFLIRFRLKRDIAEPRFYRYFFNSPVGQELLDSVATGSVQQNLNITSVHGLQVPVPPLPEQRAIAHILGSLDDKIELNRRMSDTLEAMARTLFKWWFVDFLPVRAKMAAKANDPSQLLPQAEPSTWYVYAIECNNGTLYIGQAEDLRQRWLQHVGSRGASWTKRHPPVSVPYWERQPSREAAVEREKWLKTGYGRKWLKKEIAARTQTGDPVRAKAEGRLPAPKSDAARQAGDPGLPKEIADLFPDRFVDSELGEIPEGWETGAVGDLAEISSGKRPDVRFSEPSEQAAVPLWGGNGPMAFVAEALVDEPILLTGRVGTLGSVFRLNTPCWPSDNTLVLRAIQRSSFEYLFLQLQQIDFASLNRGSTQPLLTQSDLKAQPILLPRAKVLEHFSRFTSRLYRRIEESERETKTLALLRDALLPKLISGELRVGAGSA